MAEHPEFNVPNYVTIVQLQQATDDTDCYVAYHPELPNCISQGATPQEAEENLVEATQLTIAHLVASHLPIPEPMAPFQSSRGPVQVINPCGPADSGRLLQLQPAA